MHLYAVSVGDAVPRTFDAVVHSVFQSALNLRATGVDELLTLVIASEADLPQGIRLDTPDDFSFEKFDVGESATCTDNDLRIDSLTIGLHHARRWKCDLSKLEFDPTQPAVSSAWNFVWDALNQRQRLADSEIIADELFLQNEPTQKGISQKIGAALHALIDSTRGYDATDSSAIESLIGLGSGLTPSGDDILIGYLTGLWCTTKDKNERMQFISKLGEIILSLLPKTNDISRTYLYHATQGQVSSRLANLAEAICRGEGRDQLIEIAEAAMRVGHTSGMDTVTGLLVGISAWSDLEHNRMNCDYERKSKRGPQTVRN